MKNETRSPIVVILGHVDHGKTTLISKIKEVDLTKKEFGGISQHIGAYQIKVKSPSGEMKRITFIDTPGHITFSQMRSRGAKVADLAILVVAVDEGVKPQTLESLKHIKAAKIPYLVAINKIDLPIAKIDWVKGNLAENKILVEGYGGDILAVPISAKTGKGIGQLLEMVLLLTEMAELKANPQGKLEAVIIESRLDKSRGPLATVLVRDGTLNIGEEIMAEKTSAKVKAMFDEDGKKVNQAGSGQSVEVLGFGQVPPVGAKLVKSSVEKPLPLTKPKKEVSKTKKVVDKKEKGLKIILKADVLGTLEAILNSFPEEVKVILSKVGEINESDVLLASSTGAEIIGFNIKVAGRIKKLAETEKIKIKTYQVIYDLLEEIEKRVLKKLEPTIDEEILGEAEIIAEFEIKGQRIAGCRVKKGQISKENKVHLKRGKKILGDAGIKSLRIGKERVEKVKVKDEFGLILSDSLDFVIGDVLVSYRPAAK